MKFHIISSNAAPFESDGLFDIRQTNEYELSSEFTKEQAIIYARRWFKHELKDYGIIVSDIEALLGCVSREVKDRTGDMLSEFYYLACSEVEEMQFPYELVESQKRQLEIIHRNKEYFAKIQEEANYLLERKLTA